jgi:glycosyltransferase involved in cell wall biosynthesis
VNLLIITDAYAPSRTSAAVLLKDLAQACIQEGHQVSVVVPSAKQEKSVHIYEEGGVQIIVVKAFRTKDIAYMQRVLAEWINPYLMGYRLFRSQQFKDLKIDGIVWYSPSIFWAPLVKRCRNFFACPSYLVLRDLFPDWALDLGLLKKGPIFSFFKYIEQKQYAQASSIGVQSENNLSYFQEHFPQFAHKAQVLWNWIAPSSNTRCSIQIHNTALRDRKVAVYAGNVGVAQGKDALLAMTQALHEAGIGIVFVGRGSEMRAMQEEVKNQGLVNVLFFDEIASDEIEALYRQCSLGLLALDPRHTTHNIPGKFLSYMQSGIPVLALVNPGNDLEKLIPQYQVGAVCTTISPTVFNECVGQLLAQQERNPLGHMHEQCHRFVRDYFLPQRASIQIISQLSKA